MAFDKAQDKKEPKVVIFGENANEKETEYHRNGGGSYAWGLFLILAGIVFLLNSLHILPWSVWEMIARFWPVILILVGIDIIFSHSWIARTLSILLTIFAFLVILGIVFLEVSPATILWLPVGVTTFLASISNYLK